MNKKLKKEKEVLKIIHITDIHCSGKNPICRLDNLIEEQFKKLETIINISKKEGMPIICTGDITDNPNISYSTFTKLASILRKSKDGFYVLFGNHDLQFHSIDSKNSTALGALIESVPSVKHISQFEKDYGVCIDYEDWQDDKSITKNNSNILVCHRAVITNKMTSKVWMKNNAVDFYYNDEDNLKPYELILCGHFHKQYEFQKKDCTILNPGSLTRRSANGIEIHIPSYYEILIRKNKIEHSLKILPLTKGVEEVISDSHLSYSKVAKNIKIEINNFFNKFKINKEKNQFKNILLQVFRETEAGAFKEVLRNILINTYGNNEIGEISNGHNRISKSKKHSLKGRSKE